ncbi:MAG: histidyl-tRNA synthetase [Myxococcota bacterium]|jgi:histidyl-tRNA synthetase
MAVYLPKGTRDFLPEQMRTRLFVLDTVRSVFSRFGFEPLETPAFERIETLTGKYGDEGDKLIYKILKRGEGAERGECDQALRYDLTVPLARVVAMNPGLRMPFKRYQTQPVWRADRPQRGRFREFWQCDCDIVGTNSPLAEAECIAVALAALDALGLPGAVIRMNDRRILRSIAVAAGAADKEIPFLITLDKLDKIGRDKVSAEFGRLGLDDAAVAGVWDVLTVPEGHDPALDSLDEALDDAGREGVATLRAVLDAVGRMGVALDRVQIDPTLARGLDYYTGPVFEISLPDGNIGSVGGGGRYDGLIGMFSGRDVPAVGIALGIERIIVVLEEQGKLATQRTTADVLVTVFSDDQRDVSLSFATRLRSAGVKTDLYLGEGNLKKQLKYANARGYPNIVIIGPDESERGEVTVRNLESGEQSKLSAGDAVRSFTNS